MDRIQLTGMKFYGYTGYLEEERTLGQWFELDLILGVDLAPAGQSDNLEDTLDYRGVIAQVKELIETSKFLLIERLADAIAEIALGFPQVENVQLRLSKPAPPIPNFNGKITVEITRYQADSNPF